jgi:large subunit ribosomal protein L23
VTSVRSFINQPAPRQKFGNVGRVYRPRSQKMMIAELLKPFVWPEKPQDSELEDFDHKVYKRLAKEREAQIKQRTNAMTIPLRARVETPEDRVMLKKQAAEIAERGEWKNNKNNDDEWTEVDTDVKV